ncbi:MAG TPA: prolyl oligopeptidase family serine peptidase [Vicinamibacterales bacterium]|nr:prolyl oligopeptidase family serine peptidase [Vicinamibacterales bacterium]
MRRIAIVLSAFLLLALPYSAAPTAQTAAKPTLKPADYDQFETVSSAAGRGGLSPDGKWFAYSVNKVGGDGELRISQLGGTVTKRVPFATGATFSANSQWIAYSIGVSEAEQERLTAARQPLRRKLGILNLGTQTETVLDGIDTFAFDRTSQSIAMKRSAPPAAGGAAPPAGAPAPGPGRGGPGAAAPAAAVGGTVLVRDLASGSTMTFGNVTEYSWQPRDGARLLAMIISADGQAGNGIQVFDAGSSVLRVLESTASDYSALVWRDDSGDLLALKAKSDDKRDGPTQIVLTWTGLGTGRENARVFDHTTGTALPATQRVVTFRRPSWLQGAGNSVAGILVGVTDWPAKPATPDSGRGAGRGAAPPAANEKPDVDVWHWNDTRVNPVQKLQVAADRRRNLPALLNPATGQIVMLGKSYDENVSPIRNTGIGLVSEFAPYLMDRSIGRGASDWSIVDLGTGQRTPLKARVGTNVSASTGGKYAIYAEGGHYWTIDLATKAATNITASIKSTFVDNESDSTSPERPMFGVSGWTKDDEFVLLNDRYDVWKVSPSGAGATRLTNGAADQVRHRIVNVAGQFGDPIDLSAAYVSLFGTMTKKSGYGRFAADGSVTRLVFVDKSVGALAKAEKADVYSYRIAAADDSPDLFVSGKDLTDSKQVTKSNEFLSKYAWTRAELVNYTITRGKQKIPLQGILHYPANYEAGRKYPMVVYLYEKLSDGLHNFQNPSERDYYNGTSLTQTGYFYFQPDILFTPREPGVSVVECVTAAVNKVVSMGAVDATKIGVMGHSWGGFDAMYLSTHTKLFAAAVSGAGISDLISNYGNHHWSSGIAETDHIETGQQRMVVPLYDDLQAYIRNSAVFGISTMTTPLLLEAGDSDGTVFWHQSVELYNIARRAKKNVVMLVYNGEDHGLRQKKNQIDYHRRIRAWFDHYLKGASPEAWITEGVSALQREGR